MLGTLAYPPKDIIPENLDSYDTKHHLKKGFENNEGEPRHHLTSSMLSLEWFRFILSKSDTPYPLPVKNPMSFIHSKSRNSKTDTIRCFWFGHASCLIQFNDTFILTDPVFSNSASPFPFFMRRVTPVPCSISELPEISVILLSHDHYDHFDLHTLLQIKQHSPNCIVFAPLVLADLINVFGIQCVPFDWRQHVVYKNIDFTCFPARHACCRIGIDFRERLWCSWLLNINNNEAIIYYPGDTAIGPQFAELHDYVSKLPVKNHEDEERRIDLTLVPIGPQEPACWMRAVHLDPIDAYEMQKILKSKQNFPIHYGTFPMGKEPKVPDLELLKQVWKEDNMHILAVGECMEWDGETFFVPDNQ